MVAEVFAKSRLDSGQGLMLARRVVVLGTPASGDCRRPQSAEAAIAIQAIRRLFHILASMHDVYKDKYTLQSKQIHFEI